MQHPRRIINLSQEEVDNMVMNLYSNCVLVKVEIKERTTAGGLLLDFADGAVIEDMTGDKKEYSTYLADAERIRGEVYKLPDRLYPDDDYLPWYSDIETKQGDTVYFDYYDSINSVAFAVGDYEYRVLPYSALYVAIRGEQIIPLNGYNIFEDIKEEKTSTLEVIDKVSELKARCVYTATPVRFCNKKVSDDLELNPGDIVEFRKGFKKVFLERQWYFATFDENKLYFRAHRKDIAYNHGKEEG